MKPASIFHLIRFAPIAAVAALLIPITASAAGATVQPTSGTVMAKGAAIDVDITFTCPAGGSLGGYGYSGINLSVQQAVSKTEQAAGSSMPFGSAGPACTGSAQTTTVIVTASVPGPPFRTGPAIANAYLFGSDASGVSFSAQSGPVTIDLRK